jgi:hypothetical protein
LRAFFESPTVAGLASVVAERRAEQETDEARRLEELLNEIELLSDEDELLLAAAAAAQPEGETA